MHFLKAWVGPAEVAPVFWHGDVDAEVPAPEGPWRLLAVVAVEVSWAGLL